MKYHNGQFQSLAEPPSLSEVQQAIKQLSNGNAPGADSIPADVYKLGEIQLTLQLVDLFSLIWHEEGVPQDFKDGSIIHLYKRKVTMPAATTTELFHFSQLLARFWQESC